MIHVVIQLSLQNGLHLGQPLSDVGLQLCSRYCHILPNTTTHYHFLLHTSTYYTRYYYSLLLTTTYSTYYQSLPGTTTFYHVRQMLPGTTAYYYNQNQGFASQTTTPACRPCYFYFAISPFHSAYSTALPMFGVGSPRCQKSFCISGSHFWMSASNFVPSTIPRTTRYSHVLYQALPGTTTY